jgi:hypothetical protein
MRRSRRASRLITLVVLATVVLMQAGLALGQISFGATLTVLTGRVSVVRGDGSAVQPASSGLTLNAGDRIATVGKAGALVTFFDGSEIELGADTTIALRDASGQGGVVTFLIEMVLGSAVHRVETLENPNSSYKIVAGGSVIEVGGTTVGTSIDGQGNVTAFLQEGKAKFNGYALHPREACTLDTNQAFECADQKGNNIWSVLAEGVFNGEPPKDANLSNTPKSDDEKDEPVKEPTPTLDPECGQRQC